MFKLAKLGVLPSTFLFLKYDVTLYSSCMFGTARISKWRTKGNKSRYISEETFNKPLSVVSVDQLQSDQPVLVPQLSVKLTSVLIWAAQVMVEHFSDLIYLRLTIITSQEENLSVKAAFKKWEHLGLKFVDIMQTMEKILNNLTYQKLRIPTRK